MGGHTNFILWANMRTTHDPPNKCCTKWLPWQRQLPSNGNEKSGARFTKNLMRNLRRTYDKLMTTAEVETIKRQIRAGHS